MKIFQDLNHILCKSSAIFIIMVAWSLYDPSTISGQIDKLKKQQQAAEKEIKKTQNEIKENDLKMSKSLAELGKLNIEISNTTQTIKGLEGQLKGLNSDINKLEGNIGKNESELKRLREEYLKAVKKMRANSKNMSGLAYVFSSKSLSVASRRMRYLKEFSAWRGRQTDKIQETITSLNREKEDLASKREEREKTIAQQRANEQKLTRQKSEEEVIVAELRKTGKALQTHLKKKQAEARELGASVDRLIAEEQRKAEEARRIAAQKKAEEERLLAEQKKVEEEKILAQQQKEDQKNTSPEKTDKKTGSSAKNGKKGATDKPKSDGDYANARKRQPRNESKPTITKEKIEENVSGFASMKGKLQKPTSGSFTLVSRFGRQNMGDLEDVEFENPGIDAETERGAQALAVYDGKVSGVYFLQGYDTVVIVNHGDYYTVYGNIETAGVKVGDAVESGSRLGKLAPSEEDTSHSTIHFEVRKGREKLNPEEWLR